MNFIGSLFFLMVMLHSSSFKAQEKDWELKKDKNGIQVYTREVEDMKLDEFKGEMVLNYSVSRLVDVLKKVETHPEWLANCEQAQLLKSRGDKMWVYSVTSAPFPVSDRDGIAIFHFQAIETGMKVSMAGAADYLPEKKDKVRIPYLKGFWLLEAKGEKKTKVSYQVQADPGGSIPIWLANAAAVDNPYQSLKNLRDFLNQN